MPKIQLDGFMHFKIHTMMTIINYLLCCRIIRTMPILILRTISKVVKSYFLDHVCIFTRRYTEESRSSTEFYK